MGTRGFARRLQRAAGWCKAAGRSLNRITPEPRTETIVGCDGSARYRAYERRFFYRNESGTAEVYAPLSLILRGKGAF